MTEPEMPVIGDQLMRERLADGADETVYARWLDGAPVGPPPITLDEIAGVLGPDWTAGMDSVTWVRAQRDDDPDWPTQELRDTTEEEQ